MENALNIELSVKLPGGGLIKPFNNILNKNLEIANKEISDRLQRAIKEEHRYNHDTRNLRNATKSKGTITSNEGLKIFVDLGKAHYAKFIIQGQRSWQPDPYLNDALENYKNWIVSKIKKAVQLSVVQFNSR